MDAFNSASSIDVKVNTEMQQVVEVKMEQVFTKIGDIYNYDITNASGAEITLPVGLVMGIVASTNKATPWVSTATDGSQYPQGCLTNGLVIPDGATARAGIAISGEIPEQNLHVAGLEELDTVVELKTLKSRLYSDARILVVSSVDHTKSDNYPLT